MVFPVSIYVRLVGMFSLRLVDNLLKHMPFLAYTEVVPLQIFALTMRKQKQK